MKYQYTVKSETLHWSHDLYHSILIIMKEIRVVRHTNFECAFFSYCSVAARRHANQGKLKYLIDHSFQFQQVSPW